MSNEPVDAEKLAIVARRYHHNGETQEQIAKDLRVAQGTVSNWLTVARERGVVAVDIDPNVALTGTEHHDLSRKLRDRYGLRECLVIDPIKPSVYADVRADVLHVVIANTAGRVR